MERTPTLGSLLPALIAFLLIGGPLVLVIWHQLSEFLLGRFHPGSQALAVVLFGVFLWLAARLGRHLQRIDGAL